MCHWEFSQMCDMTDWSKLCDKSRNRCPFPRLVGSRYTLSPSSRLPDECNIALPRGPSVTPRTLAPARLPPSVVFPSGTRANHLTV